MKENFLLKKCPEDVFCGGCIYQGVAYEEQLRIKEEEVLSLLADKKVEPARVLGIEGCPNIYRYRNKMEYTFGDMTKGGETTLGMHRKGSYMSIVTVDNCQLVDEDFNTVLKATLDFVRERGYERYNKRTHTGLMRNLIVRKGVRTEELLVNIVTQSDNAAGLGFDERAYADMIRSLPLHNSVVGVLRTENDSLADAVVCEKLTAIWGRDYYNEIISGLKFEVSAFSFFQTNVEAAERLYADAVELIDSLEGKTVFDLYCGTGTISQIMAKRAKKVVGIELVPEAVMAAKRNAEINGLDNCEFIAGDVFEVLDSVSETPDVIVVDPPRVGIQPKALDKIISYGVKEIVYVSCNPKTLAENLRYFDYYGYKCQYLKPYDNFAMTGHVETVCLMSRVKGK